MAARAVAVGAVGAARGAFSHVLPAAAAAVSREDFRIPRQSISTVAAAARRASEQLGVASTNQKVATPDKTVVVLGASGQIGGLLASNAFNAGNYVVGTARRKPVVAPPYKWVVTPGDKVYKSEFWRDVFIAELGNSDEVVLFNTIGGAHPKDGESMEDMNVRPVIASSEGFQRALQFLGIPGVYVHLSSIATFYTPRSDYGKSKREAFEYLRDQGPANTVVFNVGYTLDSVNLADRRYTYDREVHKPHAWRPEDVAGLPFQIVIGSGDQLFQIMFLGDLVEGGLNISPRREGFTEVNAVGRQIVSQKELFEFYTDLRLKQFYPVSMPVPLAAVVARNFPHGHNASYAVDYLRAAEREAFRPLSAEPFEQEFLGRRTTRLEEIPIFGDPKNPIIFEPPPIREFSKIVAWALIRRPSILFELFQATRSRG